MTIRASAIGVLDALTDVVLTLEARFDEPSVRRRRRRPARERRVPVPVGQVVEPSVLSTPEGPAEPKREPIARAMTFSIKRSTKRELELGRLLYPPLDYEKPQTRADCADGARPCPFVSCRHHLYLDVNPRTGSLKLNFPSLDVWELPDSCALDVADRGGRTLEQVGEVMNLERERVRQIELRLTTRLRENGTGSQLAGAA